MPWAFAILMSLVAAEDPRISLVELQVARNHPAALAAAEQLAAEDPETARRLGVDYLRGHLLLQMDRRAEAAQAFFATLSSTPSLGPYGRFQLALEQQRCGHPEVAAGLVATLLASGPPAALESRATRMLRQTIFRGGDCRLLRGIDVARFRPADRRQLRLTQAGCALRGGDADRARQLWYELLVEDRSDEVARLAADQLALANESLTVKTQYLVGLTLHDHREFNRALPHLAAVLAPPPEARGLTSLESFTAHYALARCHFWEGRYAEAASAFGRLAVVTANVSRRAQVLYQQARSLELMGAWDKASAVFQLAYQVEPAGSWAAAAQISYLRLAWRQGHEAAALQAVESLRATKQGATAARALLFLASSDLVQGRSDRAGAWLAAAGHQGELPRQELTYWQGRLEEVRGRSQSAVEHYLRALKENPYHPFGQAARQRLAGVELAPWARAAGRQLAASSRLEDLHGAWLLLGTGDERGLRARRQLAERLAADPVAGPYLRLQAEPVETWPLWQAPLRQADEIFLALGVFDEGAPAVLRHFPVAQPSLAFTGSQALARAGETRRALYLAEVLSQRIPARVPPELLPAAYRQLLYPFGYGYLILRETSERGVDPYLLAAIIREESRFDPRAFSAASARGLTQFVLPTAERLAPAIGRPSFVAEDLEDPEVAIALGAAYLRRLERDFGGTLPQMVAAYNAGEPQAALWRRYCYTDELPEYLSKVAFRETRGYLSKVLTSHAHYTEIYAQPDSAAR